MAGHNMLKYRLRPVARQGLERGRRSSSCRLGIGSNADGDGLVGHAARLLGGNPMVKGNAWDQCGGDYTPDPVGGCACGQGGRRCYVPGHMAFGILIDERLLRSSHV